MVGLRNWSRAQDIVVFGEACFVDVHRMKDYADICELQARIVALLSKITERACC